MSAHYYFSDFPPKFGTTEPCRVLGEREIMNTYTS